MIHVIVDVVVDEVGNGMGWSGSVLFRFSFLFFFFFVNRFYF